MKKSNFTMIEMVIVVAILLFLSAGLFALGNNLFKKYYMMQGKMEYLKIQDALSLYKSITGDYPPDYVSSSQNENGSGAGTGKWHAVKWAMNQVQATAFYKDFEAPAGNPKALVNYLDLGHTYWGVWVWDWHGDIGGELPTRLEDGRKGGYVCKNKLTITDDKDEILGFFGTTFPNPASSTGSESSGNYYYKILNVDAATGRTMQHCGSPFSNCSDDVNKVPLPGQNGEAWSCGWHNKVGDLWEGAYDQEESSKVLYDFLCRPMKGRLRDGVPINPKYENCKPLMEVSSKLIRPAGKAPPSLCDGSVTNSSTISSQSYKRYGEGMYNMTDSFEIIDVWGESYLFRSSANEYTTPTDTKVPPYKSFWLSEFGAVDKAGFQLDIYPPFYNPGSYDLGSKGPDKRAQNWVAMDYKLVSPSGYGETTAGGYQSYIFGQPDDSVSAQTYFHVLPSEDLKQSDFDNDNINNFAQNQN